MWEHYRRTFLRMQVFIVCVCLALRYLIDREWHVVGVAFVVMQVASVFGAWNATRIRRRLEREAERLPLEK